MIKENQNNLAFIDIETTGLDRQKNEIIEAALVKVQQSDFKVLDIWQTKIKPLNIKTAHPQALIVNGYKKEKWAEAPHPKIALETFSQKTKNCIIVAHNVSFDRPFLEDHFRKWDIPVRWDYHSLDTVTLAYYKLKPLTSLKLSEIAKKLKIEQTHHHEALDDALTCFEIFKKLMENGD